MFFSRLYCNSILYFNPLMDIILLEYLYGGDQLTSAFSLRDCTKEDTPSTVFFVSHKLKIYNIYYGVWNDFSIPIPHTLIFFSKKKNKQKSMCQEREGRHLCIMFISLLIPLSSYLEGKLWTNEENIQLWINTLEEREFSQPTSVSSSPTKSLDSDVFLQLPAGGGMYFLDQERILKRRCMDDFVRLLSLEMTSSRRFFCCFFVVSLLSQSKICKIYFEVRGVPRGTANNSGGE